jgi:hypothetical protein
MPEYGSGQWPYPNSSATPDVPADVLLLAQRIDLMSSGWTVTANATTRGALVTNGDAYEGLRVYQIDTGVAYRYTGSAWKEQSQFERHQADTTNSVRGVLQQSGIGKITGAGTADGSEAVTFPVAFGALPVVVANFLGARATGAYNPVGLSALTVGTGSAQVPSTTGFTAVIYRSSGTFTSGNDYYYSWVAYGVSA